LARTLNLGILAHVDAGKTSLTERLLFNAGVIAEIGSVDDGSTQTDTLALERQRGITIRSAVVSFAIDDVAVNLIDTPGHPDFIAEVERVLHVLDGVVLVVSAVEGVQAQTRVLMRTLQRLHLPTVFFVNKLDRRGARPGEVLDEIRAKLTPAAVVPGADGAAEVLAEHDDAILAAYVDDPASLGADRLRRALAVQSRRALVHPVYFGSAITGAGVPELTAGIREFLPAVEGDPDGPASGSVFKVERGPAGEKIAYVRMFSGTLRERDRVPGKVTAISVFDHGGARRRGSVSAGQIATLRGLDAVRIGDPIGRPGGAAAGHLFAPPTLETVVEPRHPADRGALHAALSQLTEQDPLIDLRLAGNEIFVSLYGEVQKEVIQATLADGYGIEVTFHESTTICIERPVGTGAAAEFIGRAPFRATVGLRIEPAAIGSGVGYRLAVELGSMPLSFFRAVEETVRETLRQGLHGWAVTDCAVTLTHSGFTPPPSTAGDFRNLTPLVLMDALKQAGTAVFEPMHRFRLEIPVDTLGTLLPVLAALRAVPETPVSHGASGVLEGLVPAGRVHELTRQLPGLTRGEGVLESGFDHYRPVRGAVPTRPRTDHNPLNRREYLTRVARVYA
jgi:ribosomal protection tetracycline resistance protein